MFSKFDEETRKVLLNMQKEMVDLKHPYIGSEHLFLSILKYGNDSIKNKLRINGIEYDNFREELIKVVGVGKESNNFFLYTPLLRNIIESASLSSSDKGKSAVDAMDLLIALLDEGEGIAIRILLGMNINVDMLYDEVVTYSAKHMKKGKCLVDDFGIDLNEKARKGEVDPVVGRDDEIRRLLEILARRCKNNPLLIGDAGVGKTAIVEELARLIVSGKVPAVLKDKRIVSIAMANLVAGTKYRGEFEERISKIISELEDNQDIILFIDEIHTLVGAGGAEGAIDASNILKPALARGKIKVIGATTTSEYKEFIESDKALSRRFQLLNVDEPTLDVVKNILLKLRPIYESYHKVRISEEVIDKIIYLSDKFIYDRKMPDKAIDILDEVCSKVSINSLGKNNIFDDLAIEIENIRKLKNAAIINNNFKDAVMYRKQEMEMMSKKNKLELKGLKDVVKSIGVKDVKLVVESRSKVPVFDNGCDIVLKKFLPTLNGLVMGQDYAVGELYKATRKVRCGYKDNNKPSSYLFVGSSGVGKTLLAKEFAKLCYGNNSLIRLDMSEYKESHSISKIIGSPPGYVGYDDNNNVFENVKDKPYSVILLDEIEQASPNIISLFLQILDEGSAKNSKGEIIRFDNTTIIMTSNIGSEKKKVGFNNMSCDDYDNELKLFFGVPFLNRIDKIIYFNKLDKNVIYNIIESKLNCLKKKYKGFGFNIKYDKNIISSLCGLVDYDLFGARKIDKVIEEKVENQIFDKMVLGVKNIKVCDLEITV